MEDSMDSIPNRPLIDTVSNVLATPILVAFSILLLFIWVVFGTIIWITLMIRISVLFSISMLHSLYLQTDTHSNKTQIFSSLAKFYILIYIEIIKMPNTIWHPIELKEQMQVTRDVLKSEYDTLVRHWVLSLVVFLSIILSIGFSSAWLGVKVFDVQVINTFFKPK